ncbi:MAG: cation diffusion facilitator family transporter [Asgard group archaeon]|nr:cation diffusion facilitator family transporter [Asgard group archaeon]
MHNQKSQKNIKSMIIVAIVVSLLLILKITVGLISNSSALLSDAVHSVMDLVVAIVSIIGLLISRKKPTEKFSYGFYKIENIITLLISFVIFASAGELIYEGIKRILSPPELNIPYLAIGSAAISSIASLLLGLYLLKVGRTSNSPTLKSNAKDKLTDTVTSLIVLSAIVSSFFDIPYFEGIVTILISLITIFVGITIAKEAIYALLDITDEELIKKVGEVISKNENVKNYSKVRMRQAGGYYFGDCEIRVDSSLNIEEAHDISEKIKEEIKEAIPQTISFVVHTEPEKKDQIIALFPIKEDQGLDSPLAEHFGRAPKILIVEINKKTQERNLVNVLDNPFVERKRLAGLALIRLIDHQKVNALITKNIGEIVFYKLKGENIDIYEGSCKSVKECLDDFRNNKLSILLEPTKIKEINDEPED